MPRRTLSHRSTLSPRVLIALGALAIGAGCSGDSSTSPQLATSAPPAGVWHAVVDAGPLHAVDIDTRYLIATANLRYCGALPPNGCVIAGNVLDYRTTDSVTMRVAYLQQTIIVTFNGAFYDDGRLRGKLVVSSSNNDEPAVTVEMSRTR
jgi:hypothetical protein